MRFPRPLSLLTLLPLLSLTLLVSLGVVAQAPAPANVPNGPAPFTGSELTKLRLLSTYKTALLAQQNFNAVQQTTQKAINEWNAAIEQAVKDEKLPKGTTFQVDVSKDEVLMVTPHSTPIPANPPVKKEAPLTPAPAPDKK